MRFKLDENLPVEIINDLRALGYDTDTVADEGMTGAPDSELRVRAIQDGRILFTLDKGIADIRSGELGASSGIVLFRPGAMGRGTVLAFIRQFLPDVLAAPMAGAIVIVSKSGLRIRTL